METIELFLRDVVDTIMNYVTPQLIGSFLMGLMLLAVIWEWADQDKDKKE